MYLKIMKVPRIDMVLFLSNKNRRILHAFYFFIQFNNRVFMLSYFYFCFCCYYRILFLKHKKVYSIFKPLKFGIRLCP